MTQTVQVVPRSAGPRVWQALRNYTRHHGVWTPGVKLMRNLDLQTKTTICLGLSLLVLAFPLQEAVRARCHNWQDSQRAKHGVAQTEDLRLLGQSLSQFNDAFIDEQRAKNTAPLGLLQTAEKAAFEQLQQDTEGASVDPIIKRAMAGLVDARSAFLSRIQDKGTDPATRSPRSDALATYSEQLQRVNLAVGAASGGTIDQDPEHRELRWGVSDKLTHLHLQMIELKRMAAWMYLAPQKHEFVERYATRVVLAQLLFEQAQPHLDMVKAQGLLAATSTETDLAAIQRFLQSASQVARVSQTAATPEDLALASVTGSLYLDQATDALAHNSTLVQTGMGVLIRHIDEDRAELLHALMWESIWMVVVMGLTTYLMLCTYRVLGGGLRVLGKNLDALGQGKLDIAIQGWGKDEIGKALCALGTAAHQFSHLLEAVSQGVASVSQASKEVATGNQGLSTRTEDIRTAITHVGNKTRTFSSAMDECGGKVSTAADHVRNMRADAERSHKAMSSLRDSMRALQSKSREIAQVVSLVETVAYQTKLLSLNASVEAARAGPAGRGFAIVAQEVRALARRSEDAARSIHTIVNSSVNVIEDGTIMSDRASEAVDHTGTAIAAVDQIMSEIVRLTHTGVNESQEVLGIAREVETSAEGNARLVEQLSRASIALRSQGDSLKRSVRHFVFG